MNLKKFSGLTFAIALIGALLADSALAQNYSYQPAYQQRVYQQPVYQSGYQQYGNQQRANRSGYQQYGNQQARTRQNTYSHNVYSNLYDQDKYQQNGYLQNGYTQRGSQTNFPRQTYQMPVQELQHQIQGQAIDLGYSNGNPFQRQQMNQGSYYQGTVQGGYQTELIPPRGSGIPAYQNRQTFQATGSSHPIQGGSAQSDYQKTLINKGGSKTIDGNQYDTWAGAGFDTRPDSMIGVQVDSEGNKFAGAKAGIGSGLYGEAGVSQSGMIGKVPVTNSAHGSGFVGVEGEAKAGLGNDGLEVGVGGFAGGKVSGTVGTEIGAVGASGTAEGWSGAGVDAGVNLGYDDGKVKFGGELGAALGVGGKLGFQAEVDVKEIGEDIHGAGKKVGQWGKETGQKVGNWTKEAGKDVGNFGKQAGQKVGNTAKKVGKNVGNTAKKVGSGIGDAAKGVGKGIGKLFKKK